MLLAHNILVFVCEMIVLVSDQNLIIYSLNLKGLLFVVWDELVRIPLKSTCIGTFNKVQIRGNLA